MAPSNSILPGLLMKVCLMKRLLHACMVSPDGNDVASPPPVGRPWIFTEQAGHNDLKQALARRRIPRDKATLKSGLTSYVRGLQRRPAKLRALFQAPTIRYAA